MSWRRSGSRRTVLSASNKVLKTDKKFSPADMLALQTDITSEYDRFFADKMVYAIDHSAKTTDRTRQAADIMRGWDGRMLADAVAPTIEVRTRRYLWEMLLDPKLGNDADNYEWSEAAVALENIVANQRRPGCLRAIPTLMTC
jgi:penicillin G amidase